MPYPNKSGVPRKNQQCQQGAGVMPPPQILIRRPAPEQSRVPLPDRAGRSCACHEDDAVFTHVKGYNGTMHPAAICRKCQKITFDDAETHAKASGGEDVFGFVDPLEREGMRQRRKNRPTHEPGDDDIGERVVMKSVAEALFGTLLRKADYIDNPEAHGLRWITVHPNGDDSKGVPLLVHDNGEQYTVVGGAGGKMNQMVMQKPKGKEWDARKTARRARRDELQKQKKAAMTEDEKAWREKATQERSKAAEGFKGLREAIAAKMGLKKNQSVREALKREADKRAYVANKNATPEKKAEFLAVVEEEHEKEVKQAIDKVIAQVVEDTALAAMGDGDGTGEIKPVTAKVGRRSISVKLDDEDFKQASSMLAAAMAHRARASAIERALDSGSEEALKGVQLVMQNAEPTEAEKADLIAKKYLDNKSVALNTRLIVDSEGTLKTNEETGEEGYNRYSQRLINRHQRAGASDGLNAFTGSQINEAILTPDAVSILGVENAARVAAAYLSRKGKAGKEQQEDILHRVAVQSTAAITARFAQLDDLQHSVVDAAIEAASDPELPTISMAQAVAAKARFSVQKMRLLNTTRGQLRGAAAMAHYMEYADQFADKPIELDGGSTEIAAHDMANRIGLKDGAYDIEAVGRGKHEEGDEETGEGAGTKFGRYKVVVHPEHIADIATPHTMAAHRRNMAMDAIRQDVEERTESWCPEGFSKNIILEPHQELGAKAFCEQKRVVLNLSAGSGKTSAYYAGLAHLLSSGKIDKFIMAMPKTPRSQQMDRVTDDGRHVVGETSKFLSPEMAKQVEVVEDGASLKKALKRVASGELKGIVISPQLMRGHLQRLLDAGFGGARSAFIADEVHDYGVSSADGDDKGGKSGEKAAAQTMATRRMAASEFFCAGSGSLVRRSGADVHEVLSMVDPKGMGGRANFAASWERLARGREDVFSDVAMGGLRAKISGMMVTYHAPTERKTEDGGSEPVPLVTDGDEDNRPTVKCPLDQEDKVKIQKSNERAAKDKVSDDPKVKSGATFAQVNRIRSICDTSSGKQNKIIDYISKRMKDPKSKGNQKTILFATKTTPLKAMKKRIEKEFPGVPIFEITGSVDDKGRAAAMRGYNENKGHAIMLCTAAANYGANLQGGTMEGGRSVIQMHTAANSAQELQVWKRAHRIGQRNDVHIWTAISDHPLESSLQYALRSIQGPQQELLGDLASQGEYSRMAAARLTDIEELAKRAEAA